MTSELKQMYQTYCFWTLNQGKTPVPYSKWKKEIIKHKNKKS